jgi:hypothetical protein
MGQANSRGRAEVVLLREESPKQNVFKGSRWSDELEKETHFEELEFFIKDERTNELVNMNLPVVLLTSGDGSFLRLSKDALVSCLSKICWCFDEPAKTARHQGSTPVGYEPTPPTDRNRNRPIPILFPAPGPDALSVVLGVLSLGCVRLRHLTPFLSFFSSVSVAGVAASPTGTDTGPKPDYRCRALLAMVEAICSITLFSSILLTEKNFRLSHVPNLNELPSFVRHVRHLKFDNARWGYDEIEAKRVRDEFAKVVTQFCDVGIKLTSLDVITQCFYSGILGSVVVKLINDASFASLLENLCLSPLEDRDMLVLDLNRFTSLKHIELARLFNAKVDADMSVISKIPECGGSCT